MGRWVRERQRLILAAELRDTMAGNQEDSIVLCRGRGKSLLLLLHSEVESLVGAMPKIASRSASSQTAAHLGLLRIFASSLCSVGVDRRGRFWVPKALARDWNGQLLRLAPKLFWRNWAAGEFRPRS